MACLSDVGRLELRIQVKIIENQMWNCQGAEECMCMLAHCCVAISAELIVCVISEKKKGFFAAPFIII